MSGRVSPNAAMARAMGELYGNQGVEKLRELGYELVPVDRSEQPCAVCGDPEPSHVHHDGERIDDYFTVGRGESDFQAATRWKRRALGEASRGG